MSPRELTVEEALQRDLDAANARIAQLQRQLDLATTRATFFLKYDQLPPVDTEIK